MTLWRLTLFLISQVSVSLAINCAGCTPLDVLSFDKIINRFRASLVKFDVAYPYGDQHDELTKDDYPTAFLFVKNAEGKVDSFRFAGDFSAEKLKNFIRQKSGIYLPLPGCIEEFDLLVDKLLRSGKEDQKKVLREAEDFWDKVHGPKMHKRADIYVKIMRKIVDTDISFVTKEEQRLKKLSGGKITLEKKEEMEERLNILKSFSLQEGKEEL